MSNIENLTISDVCDFIGGSQPPKTNFSDKLKDGYIRFVQTRDFKTDNFITYIPKHLTTKFFGKKDIMIGRYGPPIFQIFRGMEGAYNVALLKAKPKKNIINDYLYYFLIQKNIFEYVDKLSARTGGQTGVDLVSLYKYPINLPNISVQQKIAKVLCDLDAKIELNNRINSELEAMGKTLYDYWFVQFDFPDANGKPYKTTGGKMVWNGEIRREIPEGWESGVLSDIANITMGQSPPGESYNEEGDGMIFYQGCTDFGNRYPTIRKFTTSPTRFAKQGDILLSVRAPVGTLNISKEDCCIGRGLACMNSKNDAVTYLFGVMVNLKQTFDRRNASGTTFGSITKDDLFSLPVIIPNEKTVRAFQNLVFPAFEKQNKLELENIELASLRDWLLPMLMNGQVSVGDVEEELGMVAEERAKYGN